MTPNLNFTITHHQQEEKHFLKFSPSKKVEGYPPKEIEITLEQWNELRYHFMLATIDKTGKHTLCSL